MEANLQLLLHHPQSSQLFASNKRNYQRLQELRNESGFLMEMNRLEAHNHSSAFGAFRDGSADMSAVGFAICQIRPSSF